MKHPRARALRFPISAALVALSACSTTADAPVPAACAPEATTSDPASPAQQGQQCFVLGDVAAQGAQAFDGDMTVFEAVTRAQPRKDSANLGRVRLIRADPRDPFECIIDLRHMIETGDSTQNVHIHDRDVIIVPATQPVEPK
jgi:hypothetical protein